MTITDNELEKIRKDAEDVDDAIKFFARVYRGAHHIPAPGYPGRHGVKRFGPNGWCVNHSGDLSTFDLDTLTRLVILGHDDLWRVSIKSSGPRMVKIIIHKREGREGDIFLRHPTIEDAVSQLRKVMK